MLLSILLLIFGFVLLIKGADWLVDGGASLAKKYNVSDLAIGLTIVAFGTSAPELVVNSIASYETHFDIVFGNIIGSNNFNIFIILGLAGIISPLMVKSSTVWKEIPYSLFAVVLLFILTDNFSSSDSKYLSAIDGAILLLMFILFLLYVAKQLKSDVTDSEITTKKLSNLKISFLIIVGLAGLIFGGNLVVSNAVELAQHFQISEKIIGLTIVAAGTSLPELATSVVAAIKKNNDIAIGNIVGSNIFNIFLILSVSSFINPIKYDVKFNTDLFVLAGGTIFLFVAMFTGKKKKLDRWEAGLMFLFYIAYTIFLINNS